MSNSKNFDSHYYERHLSSFGKKVLKHLINNLDERNRNNKNAIRESREYWESGFVSDNKCSIQNKRVLTFTDSNIPPSPILCQRNVLANQSRNITPCDNNSPTSYFRDVNLPIITSYDLLKPLYKKKDVEIGNIDALLEEPNHATPNHQATIISSEDVIPRDESGSRSDLTNTSVRNYTEWDNILDTQLFNDLTNLDTNNDSSPKRVMKIGNAITPPDAEHKNDVSEVAGLAIPITENVIKAVNPVATYSDNINSVNVLNSPQNIPARNMTAVKTLDRAHYLSPSDNIESENTDILRKGKSKRQNTTKTTEAIPKKVKKAQGEELKNTFRKQKYTTAVKTWLNNVGHDHKTFEDILKPQTTVSNKDIKTKTNNLVKSKQKEIKIIQSQLTNKGGVMKFGKPKQTEVVEKQKDIELSTKIDSNIIVKDKKLKPKFIAPIKSQIPVKEVVFTINSITNDNSAEYVKTLSALKDNEIDMILLFSNGFCQLNSHYTEDTCVVAGVMFRVSSDIYYWKGVYRKFRETLWTVMKHNTIFCYDGKNLLKYFISQHDMDLTNSKLDILDAQIGGCLLEPDNSSENFTDLQKLLSFTPEYTIATECSQQKCAWYLALLGECSPKLRTLLMDNDLWRVFVEIEMQVMPIVAEMELRGVRVDMERLKSMENTLLSRMKATEQACYRAAGRAFQINSALQVRALLYEELKLDAKCNVKIRETLCKGEKSTSESMLRSLMSVHPLPKLILEYRHLHKAHATFLAGIAHQVKDGVVKATWVQTAAVTGRIASNNPNLQAIPKAPFSLVLFPDGDEESNKTERNEILNFRSVYVPREGYEMLAADFQHIECRVFAYAAADTGLLDALASPDLFRVLAAKWLNKSEEAVSSEDRERTKRIVYASLYGAGTRRLMEILGVSYDQTLSVMSSFNRTFPSLKSFGRAVVAECERRGGRLATLCGRARAFRDIASADPALRAHAERQAVNFVVQGSAADLCKLAMVAAERRLRAAAARARLLLQIHDELVWEVPRELVDRAAVIVKAAMEGVGRACGVAAPLPVALARGRSWGQMEPYAPPSPAEAAAD